MAHRLSAKCPLMRKIRSRARTAALPVGGCGCSLSGVAHGLEAKHFRAESADFSTVRPSCTSDLWLDLNVWVDAVVAEWPGTEVTSNPTGHLSEPHVML